MRDLLANMDVFGVCVCRSKHTKKCEISLLLLVFSVRVSRKAEVDELAAVAPDRVGEAKGNRDARSACGESQNLGNLPGAEGPAQGVKLNIRVNKGF